MTSGESWLSVQKVSQVKLDKAEFEGLWIRCGKESIWRQWISESKCPGYKKRNSESVLWATCFYNWSSYREKQAHPNLIYRNIYIPLNKPEDIQSGRRSLHIWKGSVHLRYIYIYIFEFLLLRRLSKKCPVPFKIVLKR